MAQLAIRGHATRGKEVIEILEMLGGNNKYNFRGNEDEWFVLNRTIQRSDILFDEKGFTLEEFLVKFPYKVGNTVLAYCEGICAQFTIQDMRWNYEFNKIEYKICQSWCDTSLIQPYKEESMEKDTNKAIFEGNAQSCDIMNDIIKEETMEDKGTLEQIDLTRELRIADEVEVILGDYEFVLKDGKTYFVKKKPQYPKTYDECCKILGIEDRENGYCGYEYELLGEFQQLLICRDAYWKIAGEQMGLGKPWKPDFTNNDEERYGIYTLANKVERDFCGVGDVNMILSFPTEEMRAAFYDNFTDLIDSCKELL